jgi:uncharacterized membrane protein
MKGLQFLCLVLIGSLFALTGLRQFFVQPLETPWVNAVWFGIQVLPLLLVLPGVLRGDARGYFFVVAAASLYFIHGTLEAATPGLRAIGLWEVGFSVALAGPASLAMRRLPRAR